MLGTDNSALGLHNLVEKMIKCNVGEAGCDEGGRSEGNNFKLTQ